MATIVCQGLQSCRDPHFVQEPMTTLRLKLVASKTTTNHHSFAPSLLDLTPSTPPHCHPLNTTPQQLLEDPKHTHHHHHHHHHPISSSSSSSNPNMGLGLGLRGWSFLHALSTTNYQEPSKPDQEPPVYVHPLARASALKLSPRSLELCTENLGSESSNIITFDDDDGDPRDGGKSAKREQTAPRSCSTRQIMDVENASRKAKPRTNISNSNSNSFPPPLTTIANDSIRVRPHRQEGRLILEAVRVPPGNRSCFHAERSHGRLRLCFFKDKSPLRFDSEEDDDEGEKDVEARTEGDAENETAENDVAEEEEEEEEEEEAGGELLLVNEEEEEEEAEQDSDGDDLGEEGREGTYETVGSTFGIEMLRHRHRERPSWCKEGGGNEHDSNKRLLNSLLVATPS